MLSSAPALALSQRGHVFGFSYGSTGEGQLLNPGEGQLLNPGAVAVNNATGDVYVVDRGHGRIVQFGPHGEFISAWGWGVKKGSAGKEYEVCDAGECNSSGVSGSGKDEFNQNVQAIAVDNCTRSDSKPCTEEEDPSVGDVYVAKESGKEEREAIVKFTPGGKPLEEISKVKWKEAGEKRPDEEELEAEEAYGLTVAPKGTVWLYYDEELFGLSDRALKEATESQIPLSVGLTGEPAADLAVDAREHFYIGHQRDVGTTGRLLRMTSKWEVVSGEAGERELAEVAEAPEALDDEDNAAVATNPLDVAANEVNERDDVYVDDLKSVDGTESTTVAQFGPGGKLLQRFTIGGLREGAGIAVDADTGAVYVSDAATGKIDAFELEAGAAPSVDGVSAQDVTSASAQLEAEIDPAGAAAAYAFRYAPGAVPGAGEACTQPCVQVEGLVPGQGYGDEAVGAHLQEGTGAPVLPSTAYHYRVLAGRVPGTWESEGEGAFTTLPASGQYVADGRGWEMVSPPGKNGYDVLPLGTESAGLIQAAANGRAISYLATGPFAEPEGSRSVEPAQILSTRGPDGGWQSKDLTTPNSRGSGITLGTRHFQEYEFFSPDLSLALLHPFSLPASQDGKLAEPPLSPPVTEEEAGKQEKTIYVRDDKPIGPNGEEALSEEPHGEEAVEPHGEVESALYEAAAANGVKMSNPGYLALITGANAPGAEFGGENLFFFGATSDLSHVVIKSLVPLTKGAAGQGLYEWNDGDAREGVLRQVNLLPNGTQAEEAVLGSGEYSVGANRSHAISEDGSRIVWTAGAGQSGRLFVRNTAAEPEETIRLDKSQGVAETSGGAVFQVASADGSRVFFTDTEPLTKESGEPGKPDLYVCEVAESKTTHGLEECKLTDLTPKRANAEHEQESADVQGYEEEGAPGLPSSDTGGVLGASEDGSYVYFVADGVLSEAANAEGEKATPGLCGSEGLPGTTCNLYVEHYDSQQESWEPPRFIATLSSEDQRDWQAESGQGELTSRVSPNGRFLAFMSDRELTGYDNADTHLQASGAHDEEVYEYAAATAAEELQGEPGTLACASCDPSGARPAGVLDPARTGGKGRCEAHESGESDQESSELFIDQSGDWCGSWLAGSVPEWPGFTGYSTQALHQSRYLTDDGRLFFDSPADLVPAATNGEEDVYEYEPEGAPRGSHECTGASATFSASSAGCVGLISSGTSTSESAFLDASESGGEGEHGEQLQEGGGDAFFATAAKLVPQDVEGAFAAYDAHECTAAEPCYTQETSSSSPCETTESCRPFSYSPTTGGTAASGSPSASGNGNLTGRQKVLSSKTTKPKPLTRAQKLAKALETCRVQHRHSHRKRAACEAIARKKFGPLEKKQAEKSNVDREGGRRGVR